LESLSAYSRARMSMVVPAVMGAMIVIYLDG
jgi:hypothetical protein